MAKMFRRVDNDWAVFSDEPLSVGDIIVVGKKDGSSSRVVITEALGGNFYGNKPVTDDVIKRLKHKEMSLNVPHAKQSIFVAIEKRCKKKSPKITAAIALECFLDLMDGFDADAINVETEADLRAAYQKHIVRQFIGQ